MLEKKIVQYRHDITEILLKVALNTIPPLLPSILTDISNAKADLHLYSVTQLLCTIKINIFTEINHVLINLLFNQTD